MSTHTECPVCGRQKSAASMDAQGTLTYSCRGGHKWDGEQVPAPDAPVVTMFGLKPHDIEKEFEPLPTIDEGDSDQ